ncbi:MULTISPECIES: methionine biosynthesis PLP-dependent protein [Virgibacillus]|uniref:Cystathionine gamma-synthase n=1 Tax=Virgibacillus pantothenticus TaxID=1473 RepID=A0A0L0QQP4_VIRPA|nr:MULTISPECIES: methionine biosynthesis PLP-dependent protein [Virgibacillus]API94165.1 cystathionine gamma-synthase [Virgibacillus sp. 6R]KNE20876.1 cystathionine gamma-synthase [Virgibacillus pantothenticus]MBS7426624.1 methionine biosynthesis PLP-dependent protein [Virgibacillus sp. 19R1-5]MBU8568516.1 methionine biosynthesis PLP-dependent protein [Virgibacillus pantothenticus]MBU8599948.1 methionine biosynthesis PLP-dependent protein [Virgibacillus pantothenticus]
MIKRTLETRLVQLGNHSDPNTGAINPPIYLSTAFKHDGIGRSTGYDYSRTKNPTRTLLEAGIANLESGEQGYACSSGMAAIQLVLSLFQSGDELIVSEDIYGGTYRLLQHYANAYQFHIIYDSFTNLKDMEKRISDKTKALFIETPTNPLMQEIDIKSLASLTTKHNLLLIVDNTFLTPCLQRPIELGANIVIHSATKYIGGHNDVLAGLVIATGVEVCEKLAALHNASGAVLSPFDCWLLIRGLKTLSLRIAKHQENAQKIARFLEGQPAVKEVIYPGKGGMLSFRLHDSSWVDPFLQQLQLITFAESLGGVESFITYPATQTHADIPIKERKKRGIDNCLLRFSVGIEQAEDLKHDLNQALKQFETGT